MPSCTPWILFCWEHEASGLDFFPPCKKILANILYSAYYLSDIHLIFTTTQWGGYCKFPLFYTWETWAIRKSINWPSVTWLISPGVSIQIRLPSTSNHAPGPAFKVVLCGLCSHVRTRSLWGSGIKCDTLAMLAPCIVENEPGCFMEMPRGWGILNFS